MKYRSKITQEQKDARMRNRGFVFLVHGYKCVICGEDGATDIHEVFVTRGMLHSRPGDLTDPRNCVPVHNGECHRKAERNIDDGKKKCRDKILSRFSCEDVQDFIDGLRMKNPPKGVCP